VVSTEELLENNDRSDFRVTMYWSWY